MGFSQHSLTKQGLALCATLLQGGDLTISRVIGARQEDPGIPLEDRESLGEEIISFECNQGVIYDRSSQPNQIILPLYFRNNELTESQLMNEIGVYAIDPKEGEILFCVSVSYEAPLLLPANTEASLEITDKLILELSLAENAVVVLPSSLVFLTRPEADALYAPKAHRHPATEVDESNGSTTEAHQRWQDQELEALKAKTDAGTTAADTHQISSYPREHWTVLNHWGIYDPRRRIFYA